jgi:hypothetical protein
MSLQEEVLHLATILPREPRVPLPPGASDSEIDGFARKTGLTIPPEVREWLRFTDGPRIGPGGVFGLRDFEEVYGFLSEFRDRGWLPLGTDGCGDYYVLALDSEDRPLQPVYFIDPYVDGYSVPTYAVASSFWRFLWFLFNEELEERGWPFDPEFVLRHDATLAEVRSAALPWVANAMPDERD